jgi:hypothetical protein
MRKSVLLLCILVILTTATAAAAGKPEPSQFTITGYTVAYEYERLPNGRTSFHLIARGGGDDAPYESICAYLSTQPPYGTPESTPLSCQQLCTTYAGGVCGLAGDFSGEFTFEEWGEVDLDPVTYEGSGMGKNNGILTLVTADGTAVMEFNGRTDSQSVWGNFKVEKKEGTGDYADLKGHGDYTGNAGLVFSVTFTGKLKD